TVPEYLGRPKDSITIDDVMRHFDHCVNVAGAEHVGIGSDFDGGGGVWGCNGDNDLINLTVKMLERGYTSSQIKGFWGGNFMRVLREAQAIANQD
ncbi:MAG: membrane dipeptidase, partial [Bacteroidales bacterium]|nr:membrane dipeptidase [Bacteroidales bacterium]